MPPATMKLQFASMDRASAEAIVAWRYEEPYSIYDGEPDGVETLLNPEYRYYTTENEAGEMVGFCCFGPDARVPGGGYADADALDVGAGMRPNLTGQGFGADFVGAILDFGAETFSPSALRVTIATFNERAIRVCERAGFERVETFRGGSGESERDYAVLVKRNANRRSSQTARLPSREQRFL